MIICYGQSLRISTDPISVSSNNNIFRYDDRIYQYGLKKEECGIKITNFMESDIGRWKCVVTGKNGGEWETGVRSFRVNIVEDLQCKFLKSY